MLFNKDVKQLIYSRKEVLRVVENVSHIFRKRKEYSRNDPQLSTHKIARHVPVSQWTVWPTLHEQQIHPYHVQRVLALIAVYVPRRRAFLGAFCDNRIF